MSSNYFLNDNLIWPVLIGAILLWGIFIFKEWSSRYSKRFWMKIGLALIAIVSLALIFLKPVLNSEAKISRGVLLTRGYENDDLDSIQKIDKDIKVFNYIKGESILEGDEAISTLMILGEGVQEFDLWQLENVPTQYVGRTINNGVTNLNYTRENLIGDILVINVQYQKAKQGTKLILEAAGGIAVDSIILDSSEIQEFQLSTELKIEGKYLYSLTEKDSTGEKRNSNPIPVLITERIPLKILIMDAFPTFETKYLKNYLAEAGHKVTVRTQITTGRYKYEYFNAEKVEPVSILDKTLKKYDLLIIDAGSLKALSRNEIDLLTGSSINDGLGIFIQPSLELFNSKNKLVNLTFKGDPNRKINLDLNSKVEISKYPYQFSPEFGLQTIASYNELNLSAYKKNGIGRIGTSVLENTFELLLDGKEVQYEKLWTEIIEKLSKKISITSEFEADQLVILKDEPFNFKLRTNEQKPRVISSEGTIIPLKQDVNISNLYFGAIYPRDKGWQTLSMIKDSTITLKYYVNEDAVWNSLNSEKTINKNIEYFSKSVGEENIPESKKPIDLIWFYAIFLICMGYLWLEPKMYEV